MRSKRYGSYSSAWGAAALVLTYALVQLEWIPVSDAPLLQGAVSTVLGSLAGLAHAWITDTEADGDK